ncbi:MAG: fibronectin type III domain-containing protein, partial [bacterium]
MSRRVLFHIVPLSLVIVMGALFISCSSSGTDVAVDKEDDIWPSQVADLAVSALTDESVTLAWTAPGDDTTSGTAARYDVRYSKEQDIWSNWDEAVEAIGEPSPLASGSPQTMTISGLATDSTYYFALRTCDEAGNWSLISNICRATCFNDFVVTFADANLEAAVRSAVAKASGDIMKSDLLDLTDLFAEDNGIADLSGIEHCVRLERLIAMNNAIVDLSPVSGLQNIIVLNFSFNRISDISPLAANPGLG